MPTPILMPALSPTMEKGNLAKWLKKEGDTVKSGDVIAEIETDKATMEVESADEGTLGQILVPEGTNDVAVNTPIAMTLGAGATSAALRNAPKPEGPAKPSSPVASPVVSVAVPRSEVPPEADVPPGTERVSMTGRERRRDAMAEEMRRDKDGLGVGERGGGRPGA